jgi:hypothetical protein
VAVAVPVVADLVFGTQSALADRGTRYNRLFRRSVGMEVDEAAWNRAAYSKNRKRLLNEEVAESFFKRVLERARPFYADEHFTVDVD